MKWRKESTKLKLHGFLSTTQICRCFCVLICVRLHVHVHVCVRDLCVASCQAAVWFKLLWDDRRGLEGGEGGAQTEEAGPSCLALSNDLCIMKDGDNISHSLQGSTLWQDLHIHIFFPPPPLPSFFFFPPQIIFFFLWAGHLPPWHCSGRGEINKYVCREAHDLSRCHKNMARCWHRRTPRPCVFSAV